MTDLLAGAHVTGLHTMRPDDAGVLRAVANSGYGMPESLADLVDNSIDADAKNVLIRVFRSGPRLTQIAVVDDGVGMRPEELREAMRVGRTGKPNHALGHYGIGLKSASLSHADSLTVVSRAHGETSAVRYTTKSIEAGWKLEDLDPVSANRVIEADWPSFVPVSSHGTVVLWTDLRSFSAETGDPVRRFGQFFRRASLHLGLVFHRFIRDGLRIWIDLKDLNTAEDGLAREVQALEPFPKTSGARGYPVTFHASFSHTPSLDLKAFVWPPNSSDAGYRLDGRAAHRQGFYFFRNERLIQAGGWNGWRNNDAEPHFSLARVCVELPGAVSGDFALNMQKNGVVVPPDFVDGVTAALSGNTTMADYIRAAEKAYRSATHPEPESGRPVLAGGVPTAARKRLQKVLAPDGVATVGVTIGWETLSSAEVFRVSQETNEILLNKRYKRQLGHHAAEAALVKTLLFLLTGHDAIGHKRSKKMQERHAELNRCLLAVLNGPSR